MAENFNADKSVYRHMPLAEPTVDKAKRDLARVCSRNKYLQLWAVTSGLYLHERAFHELIKLPLADSNTVLLLITLMSVAHILKWTPVSLAQFILKLKLRKLDTTDISSNTQQERAIIINELAVKIQRLYILQALTFGVFTQLLFRYYAHNSLNSQELYNWLKGALVCDVFSLCMFILQGRRVVQSTRTVVSEVLSARTGVRAVNDDNSLISQQAGDFNDSFGVAQKGQVVQKKDE